MLLNYFQTKVFLPSDRNLIVLFQSTTSPIKENQIKNIFSVLTFLYLKVDELYHNSLFNFKQDVLLDIHFLLCIRIQLF